MSGNGGEPGRTNWQAPWHPVTGADASALEAELGLELGPQHLLQGVRVTAVARRSDCDDVLFALKGAPAPFAVVHLTWSGYPETDRRWPWTELVDDLDAFVSGRPDLNL